MNKLLKLALCAGLAFGLVGCGSSGGEGEAEPEQNNEPQELVIEESGYYLSSDTSPYVMYGVKLTNPNENYYVKFPVISVTSYDAEGNILGTSEQTLFTIAPGETIEFASQADCNQIAPANVEFKVTNLEEDYIEGNCPKVTEGIEVVDGNVVQDGSGIGYRATGFVKNNRDEDLDNAMVSVLFYSGDTLVGGQMGFADNIPAGQQVPFDNFIYSVPAYDSFKIVAMEW